MERQEIIIKCLGKRYERCTLAKDYSGMIAIESALSQLELITDCWIGMWFVRGRNIVRRARHMELLSV
jgi:hypothetical protein